MLFATPPQLETSFDQRLKDLPIERLLDEIERGAAEGPNQLLIQIVDAARHEDDVEFGKAGLQTRHQLEAVDLGHSDIDNGKVRIEPDGHRHGILGRAAADHLMRVAQHTLDGAQHARLVVHDHDP